MKPASVLLALLFGFPLAHANSPDVRFSQSLTAEERAEAGLARLNSDEVAVIDALVRRDTTKRLENASADQPPSPVFSARLSETERAAAGLSKIPEEVARLDAAVDRFQNARLARALLEPPRYLKRARVTTTENKKEREIHGSFSLSFGWGSGGYSERTGTMVVNVQEVLPGVSLTVGYSESHIKGGSGRYYRDPFERDPFYELPPPPSRAP